MESMIEDSEDVWGDLGNRSKPAVQERAHIYKNMKPAPNHQPEPEEITAKRRAKGLQAIFSVIPDANIHEDGSVTAEVRGRRFEFWPGSDCWYSHAVQKYGSGIEKLCQQIEKHLLN